MPDDETLDEGLEGDDEDVLDTDDAPDTTDDTPADDSADTAADLIKRLEALETSQKTLASSVTETLKREVGRIQSLAAKFEQAPTQANDEALRKEIGQLGDLLNDALLAIDDTALDPSVKQRVATARREAQQRSRETELRDQITETLKTMLDERLGTRQTATPTDDDRQAAVALEQEIMEDIRGFGLDPKSFDDSWTEAATIYRSEGAAGVRNLFRQKIATALREDGQADRRQGRKAGAKPAPKAAGPAKEWFEQLESADVEAGIKILRDAGIQV